MARFYPLDLGWTVRREVSDEGLVGLVAEDLIPGRHLVLGVSPVNGHLDFDVA